MRKILIVYGTRPEAIKMAPLVAEIDRSDHLQAVVAVTGQHRAMLDQVNALFGVEPAYDLNIITQRQRLEDVTSRVLGGVSDIIAQEEPDAVLVQGDTTTCFAAALAAFYRQVPVVHLEAGLRTGNLYNPFPEEANRRLTTRLAAIHLAPTPSSKANLLHDGVDEDAITVTGNSVIDALLDVVGRNIPVRNPDILRICGRRSVLVTMHRRESWGEPMARAACAIARLAKAFPDTVFLLPAHLNPAVRDVLLPPLAGHDNVLITAPLDYSDFVRSMHDCALVLTDSGGVQEEAPTFGKPVLVLRDTTERPEAVTAGTVRLVGTDDERIVRDTTRLLVDAVAYDAMARAVNPYGDGRAAWRAVRAIEHFFGLGELAAEFDCWRSVRDRNSAPDATRIIGDFAA
ncbi:MULTISPECIES: non-hydrolyzing UDP-N-acetylglucosamine 2-epimerase [Phyllobacteriaceae]|jgi:UDP-N-acetylglucosamine 2-epimerase (non-hydrolysing)|nr:MULTISPECIES: UDP-N-acetylglucosamine 2-epimerase (non-hydrolyzing) [Mesorhizobium]MBN9233998.1 UDP-N-acetylglucosamine 2-epimerase (non-hydrolyzing) [Mesorhizobium sp.]MDQ0331530.1 UDP-N-acetylglucosamine 2-epimerase (non-hydrolyzing) [Mesorhizobium sp. YL-MeA3-2017]